VKNPPPVTSSLDILESRLRTRLDAPLPGAAAQWRFAPTPALPGWSPDLTPDTARRAAALILLYPGIDGPSLALTVRRADLPHHPGQVSLPGGAIDPGESALAAALRETEEEIGVDPASLRVIGPLSSLWVIVSNFLLQPYIATTDVRPDFHPAPHEVAELLEVPMSHVIDAGRLGWSRRTIRDRDIQYPQFLLAGHAVWGATAMVLGEFACLFDPAFSPPPRPDNGS
jgi:8-oxo-dGTP pyrophosphatase MutT (NUDIX family)